MPGQGFPRIVQRWLALLRAWREWRRAQRELARMDTTLRRDIGLTAERIHLEFGSFRRYLIYHGRVHDESDFPRQ